MTAAPTVITPKAASSGQQTSERQQERAAKQEGRGGWNYL